MAFAGLSDFASMSGEITGIPYKPWWEIIQTWFFYLLCFVSLTLLYITESFSTVSCAPTVPGSPDFTTPNAYLANSVCFLKIDVVFRRAGLLVFVGSLVIYIACVWWSFIPVAVSRFGMVKKVDHLLDKQYLSSSDMKRIVTTPLSTNAGANEGNEDRKKIMESVGVARDVCRRLYFPRNCCGDTGTDTGSGDAGSGNTGSGNTGSGNSCCGSGSSCCGSGSSCCGSSPLTCLYLSRSVLVIAVSLAGLVLAFMLCDKLLTDDKPSFQCSLDNTTSTALGINEFICSNHLPSQLLPYSVAIIIILIVMVVFSFVGIIMTVRVLRSTPGSENAKKDVRLLEKDYAFVLMFSKHSTPVHGSTKIALSLVCQDKLDVLSQNVTEAIRAGDKDFLCLFLHLHEKGWEKVKEEIKNMLAGGNQNGVSSLLLKEFTEPFKKFYEAKDYQTFVHLHYILFSDEHILHNNKGCCRKIKFPEDLFNHNDFTDALKDTYNNEPMNLKVIRHILAQNPKAEESMDRDVDDQEAIKRMTNRLHAIKVIGDSLAESLTGKPVNPDPIQNPQEDRQQSQTNDNGGPTDNPENDLPNQPPDQASTKNQRGTVVVEMPGSSQASNQGTYKTFCEMSFGAPTSESTPLIAQSRKHSI